MPAFAVAALGAIVVAVIYETNPQIGKPLVALVLLALLGAAVRTGALKAATK